MNSYTITSLFLIYLQESLMFISLRIICSLQLHLSLAVGKKTSIQLINVSYPALDVFIKCFFIATCHSLTSTFLYV